MKPTVSVCLLAYNQERFIREALIGIFSQEYSRLEIILSDDCSTDGTFSIMEDMANQYCGPHRVKLNRNESNLGVGGHFSRVVGMSSGDWIVAVAGDDVSHPNRVSSLMNLIADKSYGVTALFSDVEVIDESGAVIDLNRDRLPAGKYSPLDLLKAMFTKKAPGAAACWHRSVFDVFGPLDPGVVFEDNVLLFRSLLLGKTIHCETPLLQYRRHGDNLSNMFHGSGLVLERRKILNHTAVLVNCKKDIELYAAVGQEDAIQRKKCYREICKRLFKLKCYSKILSGNRGSMFIGFMGIVLGGGNPWQAARFCWRVLIESVAGRDGNNP